MISKINKSKLFLGMSDEDILKCIKCSSGKVRSLKRNEIIFNENQTPKYLYVLIEGSIAVCKDTYSGKVTILNTFNKSGDVFGEVYVFKNNQNYEQYTIAVGDSSVLEIPKVFFYSTCGNSCGYHSILIRNMLSMLAEKAYFLNKKIQILSSGSLRGKISKYLIENKGDNNKVCMKMNREEFANFLSVARPSLSRELLKMKDEELIELKGKEIIIKDIKKLEKFL